MSKKNSFKNFTDCNRLAWDASAIHHRENADWKKLRDGFAHPQFSTFDSTMTSILTDLPVRGHSVVQIGCNNGRELLSTMSLGARSGLGIDQSVEFIKQANELTAIAGMDCKYLASDIYELPPNTPGEFDVALITIGVLNWMPDIEIFFETVSSLLATSGKLIVYETHPILEVFEPEAQDPYTTANSYFSKHPYVSEQAIVYDDSEPPKVPSSYWFSHQFGEIITACVNAGLCIDNVTEYPHSNRETEYDVYRNQQAQLPMCFSLIAHKS